MTKDSYELHRMISFAPFFTTLGWCLLLLSVFYHQLELPYLSFLLNDWQKLFAAGALLSVLGGHLCVKKRLPFLSLGGITAAILLVYLSDVPQRHDSFAIGSPVLLEVGIAFLVAIAISRLRMKSVFWEALLLATAVGALSYFIIGNEAKWLSSDDHPSFLYRFSQLRDMFPLIPFYNPEWNGGVEAREFFPSGALIPFFLFLPLFYLAPIEQLYTPIIGILLFVITPGAVYLAGRVSAASRTASAVAGLLSLTATLFWYRYALSYGTVGFVSSVALLPLVLALGARALRPDVLWRARYSALFALLFLLSLLWPLAALFYIPLGWYLLTHWRTLLSRRWALPCLTMSVLAYTFWALIFLQVSQVGGFMSSQIRPSESRQAPQVSEITLPIESAARSRESSEQGTGGTVQPGLRAHMESSHPLLLFAMIFGLPFLPPFALGIFGFTLLWLAAVGMVGTALLPTLELHRLLVVLLMVGSLPAGIAIQRLLSITSPKPAFATLLSLALLLLIPRHVQRLIDRQTKENYHVAQSPLPELVDAIRAHAGEGRVLFAGFNLHELSYGHLAPLPYLTGKPIIASRYQHDVWSYTDIIPLAYRDRKTEGVEEFLDHYNVSLVVAHETFWKRWFLRHKKRYTRVWEGGRFMMFQRTHFPNSYIEMGLGAVTEVGRSSITVLARSPELKLRFNYLPFLSASACKIMPYRPGEGVVFIHLVECPLDALITISAKNPLQRLLR